MTSIRQQVFDYIIINPDISLRELKKAFKECPSNTIREYLRQHRYMSKEVSIDVKSELIKIIKDYKTPASSRVQAIREYNNLMNDQPEETGEDPLVKLLTTLEKES